MASSLGLNRQGQARTVFRVFGIVLGVLGAVLLVWGIVGFASAFRNDYDPFAEDGLPSPVKYLGIFLLGGVCAVVGLMLLKAGFGGVALRYAAGEAAPVAKDTLEYLTDGKGIGNLGVSASSETSGPLPVGTEKTGPFCSRCGVRNDAGARFCDACGSNLA